MDKLYDAVRKMLVGGVPLNDDVVERLGLDPDFRMTAFNLLHVLKSATGMSLPDGYRILACFDRDMKLAVSPDDLNDVGRSVLAGLFAARPDGGKS
ncbi:hypothetical protein [Actinokineospora sp. UTMC 2448]|uniref:hypothetical protein n=1 Tax=Actinokineospora sp. UTMC 2448 TaxID=2268449 RepID=UPI002164E798|nr:hypothetical protein [Actinokineospora sp. UTMC 2448]